MQFFGSVAERAWIHEKRIVIYQGEHQFEELQAETLRKTNNLAEKHKVQQLLINTVINPGNRSVITNGVNENLKA